MRLLLLKVLHRILVRCVGERETRRVMGNVAKKFRIEYGPTVDQWEGIKKHFRENGIEFTEHA